MLRGSLLLFALFAVALTAWSAQTEAPVPVAEVAPLTDLVHEVDARVEELDELLASADSFEEKKAEEVHRAFGVLAVLAQAIAEHPDREQAKFQAVALREAAKQFTLETTYEDAKAAAESIRQAHAGEAKSDAPVEHDWAKLIAMYPMMMEIETRSGSINRVVRRPRGRPEEPVHASVIAILTLAMHADTHTVKDPAQIPAWQELSREYLGQITGVAKAIREKDKETAAELMMKATTTCDRCHEQFRDI
jgi:hypothetical protein